MQVLVWNSSVLIKGLMLKYMLYQQKCQYNLFCLRKLCKASPTRLASSEIPAILSGINQDCNLIVGWTVAGNSGRQRRFQKQTCKWLFQTTQEFKHAHYDNEQKHNVYFRDAQKYEEGTPGEPRRQAPALRQLSVGAWHAVSNRVQRALVQLYLQCTCTYPYTVIH